MTSPKDSPVRPTSDKVRAAVFSSLAGVVDGARFLDVFAGTGAVGIEAYSRGAAHITFVDKQTKTLSANVRLMPPETYKITAGDIFNIKLTGIYDIIYADPPYGIYDAEKILTSLMGLLDDAGILVLEESVRTNLTPEKIPMALHKERRYGDTVITYWEKK